MIKHHPYLTGLKTNLDPAFSRLGVTSCFSSTGWWLRKIAIIDGPLSISGADTINAIANTMQVSPINYEIYQYKRDKSELAILPWVGYMTAFGTKIDKALVKISLKEYQEIAKKYDVEEDFSEIWESPYLPYFVEHSSVSLIHHYACRDICELEFPPLPKEYRDALRMKCARTNRN